MKVESCRGLVTLLEVGRLVRYLAGGSFPITSLYLLPSFLSLFHLSTGCFLPRYDGMHIISVASFIIP